MWYRYVNYHFSRIAQMKRASYRVPLLGLLVLLMPLALGCDGDGDDERTAVVTLTIPFSLSFTDVVFTDFVANLRYSVPEIGPDAVSFGAVLVFIRDLEGTWTALPFTYGVESATDPFVDYTVTLGYAYELNLLDVFVESSSSDDVVWDEILSDPLLSEIRDLRVVILEALPGKNSIDLSDYEALQRYYALPE